MMLENMAPDVDYWSLNSSLYDFLDVGVGIGWAVYSVSQFVVVAWFLFAEYNWIVAVL